MVLNSAPLLLLELLIDGGRRAGVAVGPFEEGGRFHLEEGSGRDRMFWRTPSALRESRV